MDKDQTATSLEIKAINKEAVHKICSGQVVLTLAIAVKELVENALDAGATSIEIRLKEHGTDLVEVSDNGSGAVEDNFQALTLKYHTSKLRDFDDLLGVSSFGFRGEALSSLCALSDLTITTRHSSCNHATRIEYDNKGLIKSKAPCSRQVGTTVSLSNLFSPLPVRQKEFHKNVKREFNKMTNLLYAYCLICDGIRIMCTNQNKNSGKTIVVSTQASNSHRDNIACIFGSKQLQSLLELKPYVTSNIKENILSALKKNPESCSNSSNDINIDDIEIDLSEDSNEAPIEKVISSNGNELSLSQASSSSKGYTNCKAPFDFYGFISSCVHGSGRSTSDRQFYYVNSRPCEPGKVMKLINEIYRQYNSHQYPFVFINLKLQKSTIDVNVTPDKRQIFLSKEKQILDLLRGSVIKTFENLPSTLKMENCDLSKASLGSVYSTENNQNYNSTTNRAPVFNDFLKRFESNHIKSENNSKNILLCNEPNNKRKSSTMLDFIDPKYIKIESSNASDNNKLSNENNMTHQSYISETDKCIEEDNRQFVIHTDEKELVYLENTDKLPNTQIRSVEEILTYNNSLKEHNNRKDNILHVKRAIITTDKDDLVKINRKTVHLRTSIEHVKSLLDIQTEFKNHRTLNQLKFKSQINPTSNKLCEEELKREISKSSFKLMDVIGQFNLGFIVTRLNDDLFIIDQHATDEIYNFENLQKTTELSSQKLVLPQQLELTGVNEQILIDNIDIFKKNGFTFNINLEEIPTKRVKLLTVPLSKNWIFGKDDIEELLFMLKDAPSEYCRPSRVRAMFASRACRKSVMVGTALNKADMKKLVDHMAEIEKPWNCPHGRPTIRHLVNLAMVAT